MSSPTVQIQGRVITPSGAGVQSGTVTFTLSQPGSVLDGATSQRVGASVRVALGANGALPAGFALIPNDAISPSGTYYKAAFEVVDASGTTQRWTEKLQLASAPSPIDIGSVPRLDVVPGVAVGIVSAQLGGDASPATVTATGTSTGRALKDRFEVSILDFGAKCDWAGPGTGTDDTAALNEAHAFLAARGGGTIWFPVGRRCLIAGHVVLPTSGTTIFGGEGPYQRQPPIAWRGYGGLRDGFQPDPAAAPYLGSTLVMTYNGAGTAKIETYGAGHFKMDGLTLYDPSGGNLPFLLTTNTNVTIRDNGFFGSKVGTACDQDVILLGGQNQNPAGVNDPDMAFHGFTSEIANNFFGKCRRAIYAKQWVAATYIHGNFFSHTTGTNLANGAPIEFAPAANGSTGACQIVNNRFNMGGGYAYCVKQQNTSYNFIAGNDVEDAGGAAAALVYFDTNSTGNLVLVSALSGSMVAAVDLNGVNTIVQSVPSAGAKSVFPYGEYVFKGTDLRVENGSLVPFAHFKNAATGDEVWVRASMSGASIGHLFVAQPNGSSSENLALLKRDAAGNNVFILYGATKAAIQANDGDLTLIPKAGNAIRLGATSGPTERVGSGAPAVDDPVGSTYRRTDAAPYLYVKRGGGTGAWAPLVIPGLIAITYAASMAIDASAGTMFKVVANDGNAFVFTAPTNGIAGQHIFVQIKATATLNATSPFPQANGWRAATAWTPPTNGNGFVLDFVFDGSYWYQVGAAQAVPN